MSFPPENIMQSSDVISEKSEDLWVAQDKADNRNPVIESSEFAYRVNGFPFSQRWGYMR